MLQEYSRILSPVDGSEESELAFKKAVQVTKRNKGSLVIAHVVDSRNLSSSTGLEDTSVTSSLAEQARLLLEDYKKYAQTQGVDQVETVIDYGSPKVEVAKNLPEEYNINLIMIGATGLNAVERLFVGSVSEYVIRNAPCDVLVVRTDLENKREDQE